MKYAASALTLAFTAIVIAGCPPPVIGPGPVPPEEVGACPAYPADWVQTKSEYGFDGDLPEIVKADFDVTASAEWNYMRLRPEIKVLDAAKWLAAFYCQQHFRGALDDEFYQAYSGRFMDMIEDNIGADGETLEEIPEPNIDVKEEQGDDDDQNNQGSLVPYKLQFDGSGSSGGGGLVRYAWTIDGDSASVRPTFEKTFCEPGQYKVTLEVEGSNGQIARTSTNVAAKGWQWNDMRVVLMDNYDKRNRYEGIGEGETNSYEILRVMHLRGMGLGSGPCTQVYAVKQSDADEYQQLRNMSEIDPDLIILHRSAFPKGSDGAQEISLGRFLRSLADTDIHVVVYSRGMRNEQEASEFKATYDDVLAGRLHVIPIRDRDEHFEDPETMRLTAQIIRGTLEKAAEERNETAKAACLGAS